MGIKSLVEKGKNIAAETLSSLQSSAIQVKHTINSIMPESSNIIGVSDEMKSSTKSEQDESEKVGKFVGIKNKVNKKFKQLKEICDKNGIDILNVMNNSGLNYETMEPAKQLEALIYLENSLDSYVKIDKKQGTSKYVNDEAIVAAMVQNEIDAEKDGVQVNSEAITRSVNNLGENFDRLSEKEKEQTVIKIADNESQKIEHEYDKRIRKSRGKVERTRWMRERDRKIKHTRRGLFTAYSQRSGSRDAANAVKILNAEDMQYGVNQVLDTRCSKEERINVADNVMGVQYIQGVLQSYYARGQKPPKKILELATSTITAAKSKEGVQSFDNEFYQFRLECEEKGLPPYLSSEEIIAMSSGIGVGITINENMTAEQKADCLNSWDEHAVKFDDYYEVKKEYNSSVKEYIKEHPEAAQGIAETKAKYMEKYGKVPDLPHSAEKRMDLSYQGNLKGTNTEIINEELKSENENNILNNKSKTSSKSDIAKDIKTGKITMLDAINEYQEEAYDAIFEDRDLFSRNRAIAKLHITNNRKNLAKLLELSNFGSAVELIVQNISPAIKDEYAQKIKLSGITKRAIFGEGESNGAI